MQQWNILSSSGHSEALLFMFWLLAVLSQQASSLQITLHAGRPGRCVQSLVGKVTASFLFWVQSKVLLLQAYKHTAWTVYFVWLNTFLNGVNAASLSACQQGCGNLTFKNCTLNKGNPDIGIINYISWQYLHRHLPNKCKRRLVNCRKRQIHGGIS